MQLEKGSFCASGRLDVGRRKEFVEQDVVATASRAFWRRGYLATSTRDLEAETKLSTASLYNAFENKRTLFRLSLEHYVEAYVRGGLREASKLPPHQRIDFFVNSVIAALAKPKGLASCLLVNSALELPEEEKELRTFVTACLDEVEAFFREALRAAVADGTLRMDIPLEDAARGLMAMLMGLHVLARRRPGRTALESAARPMLGLLRVVPSNDRNASWKG